MNIFKSIYTWHQYMKEHEHDFDNYKKNKNWELFYKNNDYSFKNHYNNENNDFQMGFNACYEDYRSHKHFKHYSLILIKCINKICNHRINEIVDYTDGYLSAKQKIKNKK